MIRGGVYRFNYLWSHERDRGEESGRKIRHACLIVETTDFLYMFPFTSKKPVARTAGEKRMFEVVPEIECRRVGLSGSSPSYLVLDDFNKVSRSKLYDFEGIDPVGTLSPKFMEKCARQFLQAVAERRPLKGVVRS
ncbi:hypothetical protein IHQ71_21670 [Rhizobium sp. TH2]|uniref:hypothetical protein n=1 Tax=Rhizobium sp. TH2 TaxID=2775403 RepID=UPI002157A262|nr:hypothetical protein [Rhizobium sp. TH2]UVC07771.1 hypothetical protein IHQ71_21670 [Rhizobium sp. TH2]